MANLHCGNLFVTMLLGSKAKFVIAKHVVSKHICEDYRKKKNCLFFYIIYISLFRYKFWNSP